VLGDDARGPTNETHPQHRHRPSHARGTRGQIETHLRIPNASAVGDTSSRHLDHRKDVLYVNDFAHWRDPSSSATARVLRMRLITGGNGSGNDMDRSARVPLDEIRRVVRFAAAKAR